MKNVGQKPASLLTFFAWVEAFGVAWVTQMPLPRSTLLPVPVVLPLLRRIGAPLQITLPPALSLLQSGYGRYSPHACYLGRCMHRLSTALDVTSCMGRLMTPFLCNVLLY